METGDCESEDDVGVADDGGRIKVLMLDMRLWLSVVERRGALDLRLGCFGGVW